MLCKDSKKSIYEKEEEFLKNSSNFKMQPWKVLI